MNIIDGRAIAQQIESAIKATLADKKLSLSVVSIFVGEATDSALYTKRKAEAAARLGIKFSVEQLPAYTSRDELAAVIEGVNQRQDIDGFIVQLPLPEPIKIYTTDLLNLISPAKDVDGLTDTNRQELLLKNPAAFMPTPVAAVLTTLRAHYDPNWLSQLLFKSPVLNLDLPSELKNKTSVIISDGDVFAQVLKFVLVQGGLSVTIVPSTSPDLVTQTNRADVLISAVGRPEFLSIKHIKAGAVVIDVGTTLVEGKTVGDFYWLDVLTKASAATPVPGGVGPVTVAMLFANALYLKIRNLT
jgi:methylenetetrahydrofolate dehydrogenase (NADP+)/methenyltetrahydrofolate cyclohydrolase